MFVSHLLFFNLRAIFLFIFDKKYHTMDLINHSDVHEQSSVTATKSVQVVMEADQMPDTVLKRLMEEVKNDNVNEMFAYDRAHNRHNRGR